MKSPAQLPAVIVLCACTLPGWTAEQPKVTDDDLRIRGVFESALPGTEQKKSLRLIVHPHLGDLREREHLRTALGFRYGLTSRWEATLETDLYFSHGVKGVPFLRDQGFSSWHAGSKYRLGEVWASGWECSVGAEGIDVGATAKLRVNFDFKRLLGLKPKETASGR